MPPLHRPVTGQNNAHLMKTVIRDKTTGMFLTPQNMWTSDIKKARDFEHGFKALDAKRELRLQNVELHCHGGLEEGADFSYDLV